MSIHAIHRDPPPWTFGDRLRKARRSLPGRVTQERFAEMLGYPPKRYEQWESDRNLAGSETVDVARKVQDVTGYPAIWLLDLDGGPGPRGGQERDEAETITANHLRLVA